MDWSLLLLCVLTILEIIQFHQIYVNLLQEIHVFQIFQNNNDVEEKNISANNFLVFCSSVNFFISLAYLAFVYVILRRMKHNKPSQLSVGCLNFSKLKEIHFVWSTFKIIFSTTLLVSFLVNRNKVVPISIFLFSSGFLIINYKLSSDLTTLLTNKNEEETENLDLDEIHYRKLSTDEIWEEPQTKQITECIIHFPQDTGQIELSSIELTS